MLFVGTSIIHPSTEGVFLLCNILDLLIYSKNKLCKDLDIPRSNLNRYCRNEFQRLDAQLLCKLCYYFECNIEELMKYISDDEGTEQCESGGKKE